MTQDEQDTSFEKTSKDLLDFIRQSPSVFHVVENLSHMLIQHGFVPLTETEGWELVPGGKYFVTRSQSAIIAFTVPEAPDHFQIAAAHSDSPSFRLKDDPEVEKAGHYVELNVEKYGGAILSPWLDRPLSIAGRVMVESEKGIESRLIDLDRDLCMIPNLAIHMDRQINEGKKLSVQNDMMVLFGDESAKGRLLTMEAEAAGVSPEKILAADLFLYNRVPGTIWGAGREYLSSGKLDDLQSAYGCMLGLIQAAERTEEDAGEGAAEAESLEAADRLLGEEERGHESINVCAIFDNEEVGSRTKQGADSTFLSDVLKRATASLGLGEESYQKMCAAGFMVSADNAHAVHPLYENKADLVNRPVMNGGPVIKFSANQKYTTDAAAAAVFRKVCKAAGVPVQTFYNNSDVAGGSTLGNISTSHVSMNAVDIGLAQLAMHSPYETAGVKDTEYLIRAMRQFFGTSIYCEEGSVAISETD